MFGNVGRKLVEAAVGLFAVLGFLYVPLGRHTGFEHAHAVFTTPAAVAAIEDVTRAAAGLRKQAVEWFAARAEAKLEAPRHPGVASPKPGPAPIPPRLRPRRPATD